jgi:YHS domain-containing protein
MNKASESENTQTQRNMSKGAPSRVAAGATAQRSQSQQPSNDHGQSQSSQQHDDKARSSQASGASAESDEQFDPVCGMAVDVTGELAEHVERNGKTYYFCSSDCREQYETSPEDFEV